MKKVLLTLFALVCSVTIFAASVGDEFTVDGVKYQVTSVKSGQEKVCVPAQEWTSATLVIPDSVTYDAIKFAVDYIDNNAFQSNTTITSLDVAATSIYNWAFRYCYNLSSVTLREGVKSIGRETFSHISATSITLPASLNDIGGETYTSFDHNSLEKFVVTEGNTKFIVGEDGALYNTDKTQLYAFPFNYPQKFKEILPSVQTIHEAVFENCPNIADTIVLPSTLQRAAAFHNCTVIKCVILESNSSYLSNAFQNAGGIEEIIIGKGVKHLGSLMFYRCSAVRKITVLSETMPVWNYGTESNYPAFGDCGDSFADCKVYVHCGQSATYAADANKWTNFTNIIDTLLYDVDVDVANATYTVEPTSECNQVKVTVTPNDGFTFVNWDNGEIANPLTLTVTSDTMITANVKKNLGVGDTFRSNTVEGVSVLYKVLTKEPGSMTVMVGDKKCYDTSTPAAIDRETTGELTIPAKAIYFDEEYDVVEINDGAFYECKKLTGVTVPGSVKKIGYRAFYNCSLLANVTLNEGLEELVYGTFYYCPIVSITLPASLKSMGGYIFYGCEKLTTVNIPDGIEYLQEAVFSNCKSLTTITLPESLKWIDRIAFDVSGLATINCNIEKIERIGGSAFNNTPFINNLPAEGGLKYWGDILIGYATSSLTSATIKDGTRVIAADVLGWHMSDLKSVTIPATVKFIGGSAFYHLAAFDTCVINAATPPLIYKSQGVDKTNIKANALFYMWNSSSMSYDDKDVYVYVPKSALADYKANEQWNANKVHLRPIGGWDVTFVDGDGNQIGEMQHIEEGKMPVLPVITPQKTPTTESIFSFNGKWEITGGTIVEAEQTTFSDMVYTAQFDASPRPYTITFKNYDGTELWHGEFGYGLPITYGGATPERAEDAQYTYSFEAWDNGFVDGTTTVTGEMTFTATYSTTTKKYTVKFYPDAVEAGDESGNFYINKKVNYGTSLATLAAEVTADPTFVIPECYRLLGWTVDGINLYASDIVIEKVILFPLWDTDATFSVRFVNKLGSTTIDYFDDVECHQEATAPDSPTPGYKWQWDSDEWKSVTKDLVIEGLLVEEGGTAIGNISGNGENAVKVLIDGHLFIRRGDKVYSADGQELK